MNQEEADQDVADEVSEEADSRGKVTLRSSVMDFSIKSYTFLYLFLPLR